MSESIYTLENFSAYVSVGLSPKSVKDYVNYLKPFFTFLEQREKHPKDLVRTDVIEYITIRNNKGISSGSVRVSFFAIKKYYRYLVKHDAFDRLTFLDIFDDIDLPKVTFKNQKVYLKQEVEQILTIFKENTDNIVGFGNYIFLLILSTTGARRAEVGKLKVCDIDFATSHITFYNTKNKKPRSVKMSDCLVNNLLIYIEMRKNVIKDNSDHLFLNKSGCQTNTDCLDFRIRDYAKKHGIKIAFHPFRRGFATELANAKVPIDKISKILGHSSINITSAHYIYSSDLDEATLMYNLFDRNKITLRDSIKNTKIILKNELRNGVQNTTPSQNDILKMLTNIDAEVGSLKKLFENPLSS